MLSEILVHKSYISNLLHIQAQVKYLNIKIYFGLYIQCMEIIGI